MMQTLAYESGASVGTETVLQDTYRLVRRIGAGGMGEVWEATHARLPGRFAVKLLLRHLVTNQEAMVRFSREAAIMADLRHPHIVQVFDYNTTPSGTPFFVMEYLQGIDLGARLDARGQLPLDEVVPIIKQIASGLSAAHARGVVHRDLKPQNIFLCTVEGEPEDFVKILDFGISKVRSTSNQISLAAHVFGTPQFMSPEQALGRLDQIDGRTDEFALAALTFAMLAGQPPYVGDDPASLLYQVVHERPKRLAGFVSFNAAPVQMVLDRALQKDPEDRFETVTAFAAALEDAARFVADPGSAEGGRPHGLMRAFRGRRMQPDSGVGSLAPSTAPPGPAKPALALESEAVAESSGTGRRRGWSDQTLSGSFIEDERLDRIPRSPARTVALGVFAAGLVGLLFAIGGHRELDDAVAFVRRNFWAVVMSPPAVPPSSVSVDSPPPVAALPPPHSPPGRQLGQSGEIEKSGSPPTSPAPSLLAAPGAAPAAAPSAVAYGPDAEPRSGSKPNQADEAARTAFDAGSRSATASEARPSEAPSSQQFAAEPRRAAPRAGRAMKRESLDGVPLQRIEILGAGSDPAAPQAPADKPVLTPDRIEAPAAEPPSPPVGVPSPVTPISDPDAPAPPSSLP